MDKIRVVFFAEILQEELDGATRTMFQLIRRIDSSLFEFLFICASGPDTLAGFECFKIPAMPLNANYSMALPVLAKGRLKRRLAQFSPQVVHIATPSLLGSFAAQYADQNRLPVISIYHTHFISYVDYYLKYAPFLIKYAKAVMAKGQRKFYNNCDVIYVPAESIKSELEQIGVDKHRMKIWKRGIDTTLFSPKKQDSLFLQQMMGNSYPTILFASRLVWEKNLETLIAIYNLTQELQLKLNFLIVGDGVAKSECIAQMPDAVFTGKVDHETLSVLYASSDIFLFPSVSETYGNVVLEAMASGLPCIVADGGGSRDFVEQGINGFKCNPYSAGSYVYHIRLLLNQLETRRQFTAAGVRYARYFKWDELANKYFYQLRILAGQATPQSPSLVKVDAA